MEIREKALKMLALEYGEQIAPVQLRIMERSYPKELMEAFYQYVETQTLPPFTAEGYSFEYVMKKTFSSPIKTFEYLYSIMTDEEYAKLFDSIGFGKK